MERQAEKGITTLDKPTARQRIVTHKWKLNDQFCELESLLDETKKNTATD